IAGGIILALAIRAAMPPVDLRPLGVVDQAGLFDGAEAYPDDPVEVIFYPSSTQAGAALSAGEIQAYYDIRPDYWQSGEVVLTYEQAPAEQVEAMFTGWVRSRVRAGIPTEILTRIERGPDIVHRSISGARTFSSKDTILPVLVYMLVYFVRLGSSITASYMFDSIAREADDRTLEILITTVTPLQFVTGKLLGLLAVGLTQLGTWGGAILTLGFGIGYLLGFDFIDFLLSWDYLVLLLSVLLATYVLDQILAAAMGLFRVSGGAGNMFFDMINLLVGIGLLYAAYFVPRNPHTTVAVIATFFPFTASVVLPIRVVVSEVPVWQITLSQVSLWGTAVAGLFWLRRLLQTNLVAYGPPFKLRRWLGKSLRDGRVFARVKRMMVKS
ncbi:MAG: ABC transporter permease, partial [Anaerolineae bacterium]|nr:ABC transporter permease [Anaerolineae bacterium]